MSVATLVRNLLLEDPEITGWATGGILPADPRRSGRRKTDSFSKTEMGEILPTIAVVPGVNTRTMDLTAPSNAINSQVEIRIFRTDTKTSFVNVEQLLNKIRKLLHMRPVDRDGLRGIIVWMDDLPPQTTQAFEDVVYAESHYFVERLI